MEQNNTLKSPKRQIPRICSGCGKTDMVSNYSQKKRQCRSCSKKGNTSAKNMSEEAKARIGTATSQRIPWNKGKLGIYTEDARKAMGADKLGRAQTKETISKKSEALKKYYKTHQGPNSGKIMLQEQKDQISATLFAKREERINTSKEEYVEFCANIGVRLVNPENLPQMIEKQLKVDLVCECGEVYSARMYELELGHKRRCRACSSTSSGPELELFELLTSDFKIPEDKIERHSYPDFMDGEELDLFIPEFSLAIEYHGLAFHSERPVFGEKSLSKIQSMHREKFLKCAAAGVKLVQIFEDEWLQKPEIVKSMLRARFGLSQRRINARECTIRELPNVFAVKFLDRNHISGGVLARKALGLFLEKELVSVISLRRARGAIHGPATLEIARFASLKGAVVNGGFQKLLKYVESWAKDNKFDKILSYADLRFGTGSTYEKAGFERLEDTAPNYFYEKSGKRVNRFGMRKDASLPEATEREQRNAQGWYAIYDAGNAVYLKDIPNSNME